MSKKVINSLSIAVGTALLSVVAVTNADDLFRVNDLGFGYQIAADDVAEGQCGDKTTEGEDNAKAEAEGKCGEGKCGEGKCGDDMKAEEMKAEEMKAEEMKAEDMKADSEGKCGEGKCGEMKAEEVSTEDAPKQ